MPAHNLAGILNINKPAGLTSHDVVAQVRKLLGLRRVGHAGTLDPMATGVLLVCVGQATRLIEYLMSGQKIYLATVRFGQTTNTYDAEGEITADRDVTGLTEQMVRQVLPEFVGSISQVPPAFSAIKRQGVPLYKLARQGVAVQPDPRTVQVEAINLRSWQAPQAEIVVHCGPGTYIRSLAHDLGQRLGVGGHLTALSRLASGSWHLEQAITLTSLAEAVSAGRLDAVLQPKEKALGHLPQLKLSDEQEQAIATGQSITVAAFAEGIILAGLNRHGKLAAILAAGPEGVLKPKKVFVQPKG